MTNMPDKFGLALGGGGARGLAHIKICQVLDELNIKPTVIAGTSMGALVGSLYAAGMSGVEIEELAKELFSKRTDLFKRLHGNRLSNITRLFNPKTPAIIDPVPFFENLMDHALPDTFEELEIPFYVVTTDFYTQSQYVVKSGPLIPAIAASSTLPALLKPVELDGRILIDGGFVNPVPFNIITDEVDLTIAADVTGLPPKTEQTIPNSMDALIGASQIMIRSLSNTIMENNKPDFLILPDVGHYNVLDYFKMNEIFEDTMPSIDQFRRELETYLSKQTDLETANG